MNFGNFLKKSMDGILVEFIANLIIEFLGKFLKKLLRLINDVISDKFLESRPGQIILEKNLGNFLKIPSGVSGSFSI